MQVFAQRRFVVPQHTAFLLCIFAVIPATSLQAQDNSAVTQAILQRLQRLEDQNAALLKEIEALRQQIANGSTVSQTTGTQGGSGNPTPPTVPPEAAVRNLDDSSVAAEQREVSQQRIEELAQTKVEASQRYPIQLTGTALFNAFLNGSQNGGAQNPVTASPNRSAPNEGGSLRQTVLGLTFQGPRSIAGGTVSGSLYMDFFGGSGTSLDQLMRLRVATLQIAWAHGTTFAVGQDKPIVSLREPNSLAQVGVSPLTGAGNPWLWQPQARLEQTIAFTRQTLLKGTAGIYETSEGRGDTTYTGSSRPALQGRLALRHEFADDKALEVGLVGHRSETHVERQSVPSRLYGVDLFAQPFSKVQLSGLLFGGQNFANLGASGGLNEAASGQYVPIHGKGGWLQLRYLATNKLTFDLYGGVQDDRQRDLVTDQVSRNLYLAANAMYALGPNVVAAFEFGQARTDYLGLGIRLNPHYDLALAYSF